MRFVVESRTCASSLDESDPVGRSWTAQARIRSLEHALKQDMLDFVLLLSPASEKNSFMHRRGAKDN